MHPRMPGILDQAEATAGPLHLDQIAFVLAAFTRADALNPDAYLLNRPKLKVLFDECLTALDDHHTPDRFKLAMGDRDLSRNKAMVHLQFSDWLDRQDVVGDVVTCLFRDRY